jgi:hypothetical protein
MVELIAQKSWTYARRFLRAGDRFLAHDSDVRLLLAIGHARRPDTAASPSTPRPAPEAPPPMPEVPEPEPSEPERVRRVVAHPRPSSTRRSRP